MSNISRGAGIPPVTGEFLWADEAVSESSFVAGYGDQVRCLNDKNDEVLYISRKGEAGCRAIYERS